jgi:hypothetical protein
MSRFSPAVFALSLIAAVIAIPAAAAQRAFVASTGSDANSASGCGLAAPCRTFAAALTVVDNGGEVIALDAAGYGPITITKSVTITANPGFYAGIAVPTGNAVTIDTTGVNVTLRGLNINGNVRGVGINNGVSMTNGSGLSIENCAISNFEGHGVYVATPATVRIVDSIIRDNVRTGVYLYNGATATVSGSKFLGNITAGVSVDAPAGTTTTAAISDSVMMNSYNGVSAATSYTTAIVRRSVIRSTLSDNCFGAAVGGAATTVLTLSDSMVTGNSCAGLFQSGGATLESLGNNTVRQNGGNTSGTITTVSPM